MPATRDTDPVTGRRRDAWGMLLLFGILIGVNQMLVLNFAPLVTTVQARYGVSDFPAGLLTLMNPITYLVFGFYAGTALDRYGYKTVVTAAAAVMTLGAFGRSLESGYSVLLATHTLVAVSGVFITSAIGKFVSDWFAPAHIGLATGIVMALMLLGTGVGMGATPSFMAWIGWQRTLLSFAVLALAATVLFALWSREQRHTTLAAEVTGLQEARYLWGQTNLRRVFWLSFLIIGATNGINAWFEKIMSGNGFDPATAGAIIGVSLLCSVVGAAVVPALSDRWRRRRPFILMATVFGLSFTYLFLNTSSFALAAGIAGAGGIFQLPSYILLVALAAQIAGPAHAGLANGILMFANSLGGLIIAVLMERVGQWFGWHNSAVVLMAVYLLGFFIALQLREPTESRRDTAAPAVLSDGSV
ncbi:MFS transporter [Exilibacterium tricleocarpae]|uniref:MFS transporter n=1 Tax=Exilibacterium tricleocarpae TaxID=2591008 RepID=A0A545TVA2_9GAMM|nr:MFS transporter [Exilibacterium tricleocarpae]TQV81147.1 MFS transporter [Exilibacterium tricleocarpae]